MHRWGLLTTVSAPATALTQPNTRATLAEARLSDFKSMVDDIREQRDRWQQQAEWLAALASPINGRNPPRTASIVATMAAVRTSST